MAINKLCLTFRQIINRQSNIISRYCSSRILKEQNDIPFFNFSRNAINVAFPKTHIKFIPKTLNIDFGNPDSTAKKNINEIPLSKYIPSLEEPIIQRPILQDQPLIDKIFELPPTENILEKLAIRMIVIRRKKMKKHKRKKLRKRMKYVWAKIRVKRNLLKEKTIQANLIAKIREAQMFDAKTYVEQRLAILDKEELPKTFRGEILPPDMIRKLIQERIEKKDRKRNKPKLTLD